LILSGLLVVKGSNDLGANAFLLFRHTGMRIGECADLTSDCLRSTGPGQWAIHVPLGKLKTERRLEHLDGWSEKAP
jgi:hypothetical protein